MKDILRLENAPYSCKKIQIGPRNKCYRRLVSGNYIILYRINKLKKQVKIYHVYYNKRNYLISNYDMYNTY